jgi:hypothetical protein
VVAYVAAHKRGTAAYTIKAARVAAPVLPGLEFALFKLGNKA